MPTYQVTDPKTGLKVKLTGDAPPTDADLDEIFSGLAQQPAEQLQEPSLLQKAGNTAYEFASAVNRGALDIAGLPSELIRIPVNAGLQMAGVDYQIPRASQAIQEATGIGQGGYMDPGTARDIVQATGEAIPASMAAGAGLTAAASRLPALTAASEGILPGALRAAGQSTAAQNAAYGALGGGGSVAGKEIGQAVGGDVGGAIGEIAGGVAAPMIPSLASSAVKGAASSIFGAKDQTKARQIAEDFATFDAKPTVGLVSGRPGLQATETVMGSAIGGSPIAKARESIGTAMQAKLKRIAASISDVRGAEDAGLVVQKGITGKGGFIDRWKDGQAALWGKADQLIAPQGPVNLNNTKQALDGIVQGGRFGSILDNPKLSQIKQALDEGATLQYDEVRKLRSQLGSMLSNPSLVDDIPRGEVKRVYGALSEDIRALAASSGPEAAKAFNRANTYTRSGHDRIDDYLEGIAKKVNPDEVFRAIAKGGEGVKRLNSIKRSLKPEEWDVIASNVVSRLGRASPGQQIAEGEQATGDVFSIAKFATDWEKLGPARKVLFTGTENTNKYASDLNAIARAAGAYKQASAQGANYSGTAQAGARLGAATGLATSIFTGQPLVAAGVLGSIATNNVASRLMTNPKFVAILAKGINSNLSPNSIAAQLSVLAKNSTAEDAAIIYNYLQDLETQQGAEQ
jgi:hypothetical protein